MIVLPVFLNNFLEYNSFEVVELVQRSNWKDTYILKIQKDNTLFLLKAYGDNASQAIKEKFLIEKEFYQKNNKSYCPKLVLTEENIIVLEYIEGNTLRNLLIENKFKEKILKNLFLSIEDFYIDNKSDHLVNKNFNNAYTYLSDLIQSGPIQTKDVKVSIFSKIIYKLIAKVFKLRLSYLLSMLDVNKLKSGFMHGDFHYNNILISEGKIKFIDFENIKYDGFFDFDILYLTVMIDVYLQDNNLLLQMLEKNVFKREKYLKDVYKLYKKAILLNKKFLPKDV
jgi:thiamine kinase-like enzyme